MKPKFTMILILLALGVQLLNAQQKTVSGTVSDENGCPYSEQPLFVQVLVLELPQILMENTKLKPAQAMF